MIAHLCRSCDAAEIVPPGSACICRFAECIQGFLGLRFAKKMQTAGTAHQLLELLCVGAPRGLQHAAEARRALFLDMPAGGVAAQADSGVKCGPELPCASKWNVGQVQLQWSALTAHAHVCQYLLWHDLGSSGRSSGPCWQAQDATRDNELCSNQTPPHIPSQVVSYTNIL